MYGPDAVPGATTQSVRSSATFLSVCHGHQPAARPPAARTIVAWAHGFVTMELAGASGSVVTSSRRGDFGLDRVLAAVRGTASPR